MWKVRRKIWIPELSRRRAVARLMPAESYGFRPVPEELSFGQLMIQIAGANLNACANASGKQRPLIPARISQAVREGNANVDKDSVVQFLANSFEWLWAYFTHTAHHRGQAEVYLRVKGIKPPEYVF